MIAGLLRAFAMKTGRARYLYRAICKPWGQEYAEYLRRHGGFQAIGENCFISPHANITDPALVRIGNNVRVSACSIFGHDGAINMVNAAFALQLDSVGKVDIKDNVYLGHSCVIQPGVTIGPNAIVSAGSVVNRDVPEGVIVAGVPAKPVSTVAMYVQIMKIRNSNYPWRELIEQRRVDFDAELEKELTRMRVMHFFHPEEHEK